MLQHGSTEAPKFGHLALENQTKKEMNPKKVS